MLYDCLIVEDEVPLADSTCKYLNLSGVRAEAVHSVQAFDAFWQEHSARLILLDIRLADGCGYNLCRRLREETQVPIVFISCQTAEENILLGLNVGGDDFICKPYSLPILLAKVKAVLRRCPADGEGETVSFGACEVHLAQETVYRNKEPVVLKRMELKLLLYLIRNRNRLVEKEELYREVWQEAFVGDGTLNVHIRRLREKIEENPSKPKFILTEYGKGYLFRLREER